MIKQLNLNSDLFQMYQKIMDTVAECGVDGVMIAGGAIRDVLLDKDIKDIDLFYCGELNDEKLLESFKVLRHKKYLNTFLEGFLEEENPYKDSNFDVRWSQLSFEGCPYPVQILEVKDGDFQKHISTFGAGISKVALLADGSMWITPEFMRDVIEECIHFDPNCGDAYKNKIADKFPEFMAMDEVVY